MFHIGKPAGGPQLSQTSGEQGETVECGDITITSEWNFPFLSQENLPRSILTPTNDTRTLEIVFTPSETLHLCFLFISEFEKIPLKFQMEVICNVQFSL